MENETIYIRMRLRLQSLPDSIITIGDLAQIIGQDKLVNKIAKLAVYQIKKSDRNIVVIDVMKVIATIQKYYPTIEIQTIGPSQTIIDVVYKKKKPTIGLIALVWFLLFVGSAIAIMNFHEDVSMQQVHQKLYFIMTGNNLEKPLLLQIPYSLGLGIGMILFFNHFFRKRLNEEPSPLEVEMFKYQQDLDQYVIIHENKEVMKRIRS
ncbi:stage V sporulation protein AA [Calidifontibacillus erzurumensis]|uniref:Stage V sporulation protein AA n=1 Tax=Calidifontibacillus erzurumensis TaxID=2741433 RepID=A0A8J8KAV5_9BACI|nr:stage V sporulation protein AA [Calidifontibacillus erzurumensis]NSL50453.1 stage V sporulation protein AA [Calidifontibacillus erzurumensis]